MGIQQEPTVVVTGGAGFIGSALIRFLVGTSRYRVVNLDKLTYAGNLDSLKSVAGDARYRFVRGDICDRPQLDALLTDTHPQALIHLAAESHVDRSIDGPSEFIRTNIVGTYTLLEAARAYLASLPIPRRDRFRFVHVSTDEVFGSLGAEGRFFEASPYRPRSPYSASKAASDHLARAWQETFGVPVIVTNCSNNYGPFQFPEKLIPLTIIKALDWQPLPVYGNGQNVRDWLFVEDHAAALAKVVEEGVPGETYLIGGDNERANLEIVEMLCDLLDELRPRPGSKRRAQIQFVTDRPGHDFRYAINPDKIGRELGWKPRTTFETGLRRTVNWYVENAWWWRPILEKKYQMERLGTQKEVA